MIQETEQSEQQEVNNSCVISGVSKFENNSLGYVSDKTTKFSKYERFLHNMQVLKQHPLTLIHTVNNSLLNSKRPSIVGKETSRQASPRFDNEPRIHFNENNNI